MIHMPTLRAYAIETAGSHPDYHIRAGQLLVIMRAILDAPVMPPIPADLVVRQMPGVR